MKIRFFAALLIAVLSITILSGCAKAPAPVPSQPVLPSIPESTVPLAPVPQPTEAPAAPAPRITREEAIDIALKDAGLTKDQVTGLRAEFDYDNGRPEYNVDFRRDRYEYDYEIHAETGKILSRDKDWEN